MAPDHDIDHVVDGVVEGRALDWPALDSGAGSNEDRELLKCLRIVSDIAAVHRSTRDPLVADEEATHLPDAGGFAHEDRSGAWGRYRLVEKVGEGSFGSVYRAWDPELEREIAIKILHRDVASGLMKERLLREGRALARVRHPNVVSVFGVESHGDRVGLCMEFIRGKTLATVLGTHGTFNAREAALIGEDVCRALAAVHRAGFVHRDVKSRNVMREQAGRIVLMDFGTGREIEQFHVSGRFDIAGTPAYMAPEVLTGEPASACSDVYSVGVLLYHTVTSEYPVAGLTMDELREAHRKGRRTLLSERRPNLPVSFIQVVGRALEAEPALRYSSAGALLEALAAFNSEAPPKTITQRIVFGAAGFGVVIIVMTVLGFINSSQFNVMLERTAVAADSPVDWLLWGLQSLPGPVINLAQVLILVLLALAIVRVIRRLWPAGDRLAARIAQAAANAGTRVGIDYPDAFGQLVFVGGVAYLGVVWMVHWKLISALVNLVSALTPEQRMILSPANETQHLAYRSMLDYLVFGLGLSMYRLIRMRRAGSLPGNPGQMVAIGAILALATVMWDAPYRLLFRADRPRVEFEHQRCYNLGSNQRESLIYCPEGDQPKVRRVPLNDARIQDTGVTESVFTSR